MSVPLLNETEQLRWWSETEIEQRDLIVQKLHQTITTSLLDINKAWDFKRTEGPLLVPRRMVREGYTGDDIWATTQTVGGEPIVLRPETTATSYLLAKQFLGDLSTNAQKKRLPLCIWQIGKSFRREKADGASASKLRYFEFYQAEWQCIYSEDTKADYRAHLMQFLAMKIGWLTDREVRIVPSERIPSYAESTLDIEVNYGGRWTEMASVSIRKDFEGAKVLEIAVGLDRVVEASTARAL